MFRTVIDLKGGGNPTFVIDVGVTDRENLFPLWFSETSEAVHGVKRTQRAIEIGGLHDVEGFQECIIELVLATALNAVKLLLVEVRAALVAFPVRVVVLQGNVCGSGQAVKPTCDFG